MGLPRAGWVWGPWSAALTPDWSAAPEAVPYANLADPQSLNLYAYVMNNPVTAFDVDGHHCGATGPDGCPTPAPSSTKMASRQKHGKAGGGPAQRDLLKEVTEEMRLRGQAAVRSAIHAMQGGSAPPIGSPKYVYEVFHQAGAQATSGMKAVYVVGGIETGAAVASVALASGTAEAAAEAVNLAYREASDEVMTDSAPVQLVRGAAKGVAPGAGSPTTPLEAVGYAVAKLLRAVFGP